MLKKILLAGAIASLPLASAAQQQAAPPSPDTMSRQQLRDEVARLRPLVRSGAVLPQRPAGCTSEESRQFDFWLGEWDVSPSGASSGAIIAESSITLIDQGCVIMEHWRPFAAAHGHSLNMYDPATQSWHQSWMAASPLRTEYRGAFSNGVMSFEALTPLPGVPEDARSRMNFQRIDENTVRQWGEQLNAGETEWTVTWDLTYRRRAGTR
jgi:hypothetical protein